MIAFKRLVDIVLSAGCLIVLAPMMLIVAIFVRINLGSPVIFQQERPGLFGKPFRMYKFRSMLELNDGNGEALADSERLTEFGKLLRKSSLDELPGFYNVLVGDMSIVGPRPLLVENVDKYSPRQASRMDVRPGVTGLAQISGRNDVDWNEKLELDAVYVENWTMLLDMKILIKTLKVVIFARGIGKDVYERSDDFSGN